MVFSMWLEYIGYFLKKKIEDFIFRCMKIMCREILEEKGCVDNYIKIIKILLCFLR